MRRRKQGLAGVTDPRDKSWLPVLSAPPRVQSKVFQVLHIMLLHPTPSRDESVPHVTRNRNDLAGRGHTDALHFYWRLLQPSFVVWCGAVCYYSKGGPLSATLSKGKDVSQCGNRRFKSTRHASHFSYINNITQVVSEGSYCISRQK